MWLRWGILLLLFPSLPFSSGRAPVDRPAFSSARAQTADAKSSLLGGRTRSRSRKSIDARTRRARQPAPKTSRPCLWRGHPPLPQHGRPPQRLPRVGTRRGRPDSCHGHAPLASAAAAPRESLPVEAEAEEEVVEDDPGCDEYSSMRSRGVSAKACAHNQHPQDGPHCRASFDKNRAVYGPRPRKLAPAACTVLARQ